LVTDAKDLFAVSDDDVIDVFWVSPSAETVLCLVGILNVEKASLRSVLSVRESVLRDGGKASSRP
jgi:uncharacterized protein YegJ (DUF2314 family)